MYRRIMHVFYGVALIGLAFIGQAQAVALGKIDVASHLGEPFYAEVPLTLEQGEVVSNVFVELASPADYRILEVFRDGALNQLRADVKKDSRGTRVELTSDSVMEAPFFNIVLKVRYERATHFKKYPVFLDLPSSATTSGVKPVPSVSAVATKQPAEMAAPTAMAVMPEGMPSQEQAPAGFNAFDGWARTGRYGPMVFGDTVTTVAQRLKIDDRYTTQQVMVALFEKNRDKFDKDNINLIKAGTYLDVPTAAEVERITPSQARQELAKQEKQWKELTQQPRYAAVAEAQRTRYSKRVRVGEEASGVASQPMEKPGSEEESQPAPEESSQSQPVSKPASTQAEPQAGQESSAARAEQAAALAAVKAENDALKQKLAESEKKIAAMGQKPAQTPDQAAAEARIKKLEIKLARMQAERDRAREQAAAGEGPLLNWVSYALIGAIVLLMGAIGFLLMRVNKRPHPAMQEGMPEEPAMSGFEPEFEEVKEIEVEEVPGSDQNATVRMTADEFEAAMGDSIPDLTDEDTSEMEPFQEEEEEPDPNVDYLSEADVYLRYGMEEEAEQQVKMALKLRQDNKDAHIKLAEIRKSRGDQAGVDEAIGNARSALAGDALAAFEAAVASMGAAAATGASDLEDTVPPMEETLLDDGGAAGDSEESDEFTSTGEMMADEIDFSAEESAAAETGADVSLDLGDLDWSADLGGDEEKTDSEQTVVDDGAGSEATPAAEEDLSGGLDFDFSAFEEDEAVSDTEMEEAAPAATIAEGEEALDFDFGEFALPEDGGQESSAATDEESSADVPTAVEAKAEDDFDFDFGDMLEGVETSAESDEPAKQAEASGDDAGFDFGELDLSGEMGGDASGQDEGAHAEGEAETLSMDWSSDTSSLAGEAAPEETSADEADSLDLNLDLSGLDVELSEESSAGDDEDFDDFSSTLQTNLAELSGQYEKDEKESSDQAEEPALDLGGPEDTDDFDLGELGDFSLDADEASADEKPAQSDEAGADKNDGELDMDSINDAVDRFRQQKIDDDLDFEATMRLDTLLGEMSKDDDDSKGNA